MLKINGQLTRKDRSSKLTFRMLESQIETILSQRNFSLAALVQKSLVQTLKQQKLDYKQALLGLYRILIHASRPDEALEAFEEIEKLDPALAQTGLAVKGALLHAVKRTDEAKALYEELKNKGNIPKESLAVLERALAIQGGGLDVVFKVLQGKETTNNGEKPVAKQPAGKQPQPQPQPKTQMQQKSSSSAPVTTPVKQVATSAKPAAQKAKPAKAKPRAPVARVAAASKHKSAFAVLADNNYCETEEEGVETNDAVDVQFGSYPLQVTVNHTPTIPQAAQPQPEVPQQNQPNASVRSAPVPNKANKTVVGGQKVSAWSNPTQTSRDVAVSAITAPAPTVNSTVSSTFKVSPSSPTSAEPAAINDFPALVSSRKTQQLPAQKLKSSGGGDEVDVSFWKGKAQGAQMQLEAAQAEVAKLTEQMKKMQSKFDSKSMLTQTQFEKQIQEEKQKASSISMGFSLLYHTTKNQCEGMAPEEFLCPISLDIMTDPVITTSGQSYERTSIERALAAYEFDPLTRKPCKVAQLMPNYALKASIDSWKKQREILRLSLQTAQIYHGSPIASAPGQVSH